MQDNRPDSQDLNSTVSRRAFIAASSATAALPLASAAFAGTKRRGDDVLRVGVIGCGGRGTGAAFNALQASDDVEIHAMGDVFPDRLQGSRNQLKDKGVERFGDRALAAESNCFSGWDAYKDVIATDCDYVILATPPGFRPIHFEAAINGGKNVFLEKPVAVDPPGIRKVMAASKKATGEKLSVVAGTQRRHEECYLEAMKRIHDGEIGRPVSARVYWNMGGLWVKEPQADRSAMENQLRNWLYHTWLSGDHIVEQHVHNIDVANWAFQAHPVSVFGVGGRQARTGAEYGNIFDHFGLEFEYPEDRFAMSMCRQQVGTPGRVEERITGTEGICRTSSGSAAITGAHPWKFKGKQKNPYVQEHVDLQASIRGNGPYLNEGQRIAESTMCAIMGREAAYTGQVITWDEAMASNLDLTPEVYAFTERGQEAVAIPGVTTLDRTTEASS